MSDILYSPWRLKYILSKETTECIFCLDSEKSKDQDHYIIYRSDHSFVMLNMFPYNNGHLLIVPNRHTASLSELNDEELFDLLRTLKRTERIVNRVYDPDGINIGLNLGRAAGAGIDKHLHIHLVPRWSGDVNFMTVTGGTRVIPEAFDRAYSQLKEQFDNEKAEK